MISKQRYETIKNEFGTISSWAVWAPVVDSPKSGVGDLSVFESSNLLDVLNPNKLRYALKDTPYWGGYITDIIKHHAEFKQGLKIFKQSS